MEDGQSDVGGDSSSSGGTGAAARKVGGTQGGTSAEKLIPVDLDSQGAGGEGMGARVVVRGDAGTGKTTLLKHLAYMWAVGGGEASACWRQYDLVLRVPLPQLNGAAETPEGMLANHLKVRADLLEGLLSKSGSRVLLLLDALDEVPSSIEARNCAKALLGGLLHPGVSMLVTTRKIEESLLPSKSWQDCRRVTIAGFGDSQVESFVNMAAKKVGQEGDAERVLDELQGSDDLRKYARIPV